MSKIGDALALVVSNDKDERIVGDVRVVPWRAFLDRLWSGSYLS